MNKPEIVRRERMKFGLVAALLLAVFSVSGLGLSAQADEPLVNEQVVVLDVQGMS